TIFATKREMTQIWTKQGKRVPVTRCVVGDNIVIGQQQAVLNDRSTGAFVTKQTQILEVGYGQKKLKNTHQPLRSKIEKSGFSYGVKQIKGLRINQEDNEQTLPQVGSLIKLDQVLAVGDQVKISGISKGRGFSGAIKRHGMHGTQRTRGQSDRQRTIGSIGGQTPGKVWKGHHMPGRFGNTPVTVFNLTVVHLNPVTNEIWLSGPVPGHLNSTLQITKTGEAKKIELDYEASGLQAVVLAQEQESEEIVEAAQKDEPAEKVEPDTSADDKNAQAKEDAPDVQDSAQSEETLVSAEKDASVTSEKSESES
ncbi:MAG TPA: 50S ribosomal protein L3, partial [Candidatus Woesebacteria bacterium]|nr:50S ribosomal protein L3 [Candidatus Woesebacteria bacterium]